MKKVSDEDFEKFCRLIEMSVDCICHSLPIMKQLKEERQEKQQFVSTTKDNIIYVDFKDPTQNNKKSTGGFKQ